MQTAGFYTSPRPANEATTPPQTRIPGGLTNLYRQPEETMDEANTCETCRHWRHECRRNPPVIVEALVAQLHIGRG